MPCAPGSATTPSSRTSLNLSNNAGHPVSVEA
jgi:hypothetical protein